VATSRNVLGPTETLEGCIFCKSNQDHHAQRLEETQKGLDSASHTSGAEAATSLGSVRPPCDPQGSAQVVGVVRNVTFQYGGEKLHGVVHVR
jgi:hypothetical protein